VESEIDVAAVSTLAVESSLSLSDELEEVLEPGAALRTNSLNSRFLGLCTGSVICDDAKRGCLASGDAMCDQDGSRVRGFFARFERAFSSSSEDTEREGLCPLRNLGCLMGVAALIAMVGCTGVLDGGVFGRELTGGTLVVLAFVSVRVFTPFANGILEELLTSCAGIFLAFTPTGAPSTIPPVRALNIFSTPASTCMSQELASVKVDDLRKEDGRKGMVTEIGEP
jgi:hypothetical protein